jgi:hypothetical protein
MKDINGNEIDERRLLALKYTGAIKHVMNTIINSPTLYDFPPEKVKGIIIETVMRIDPTLGRFTIDRSIRKVWSMELFKPPEKIEIWRRKEQDKHQKTFEGME